MTMKTCFHGNCGPMGLIHEVAVVKTSRSGMGLGKGTICSMAQGILVYTQPLTRPDEGLMTSAYWLLKDLNGPFCDFQIWLLYLTWFDCDWSAYVFNGSFNATKCLLVFLFSSSLSFAEYMRLCHFLFVSENCREIYTWVCWHHLRALLSGLGSFQLNWIP